MRNINIFLHGTGVSVKDRITKMASAPVVVQETAAAVHVRHTSEFDR